MSYWDYGYGYYTPTTPKEVKDGIKLQSKQIGSTWWSKKWISALESFTQSNRLERGRRYARRGQVMNFKIDDNGTVSAKVQGSASRPYSITIKIKPFSDSEWVKILEKMSDQALFIAALLSGEMPQDIEKAFSDAGVSLFPKSRKEIRTECSCPDYANPCKHIASVHYVLGEEFDRDPFMIFKLRGRTEQHVISELRKLRSFDAEMPEEEVSSEQEQEYKTIQLNESISDFWLLGDEFNKIQISITPPTVPLAILKRLGTPPFWQDDDFWQDMEKIYKLMSDSAMKESYSLTEYERKKQTDEDMQTGKNNIILHGTWIPETGYGKENTGKFILWGEKIKASAAEKITGKVPGKKDKEKTKKAGGKKGKKDKVPDHPFCIPYEELVEIAEALDFNLSSNSNKPGNSDKSLFNSIIFALPGSKNPHPSFKRVETETLSSWKVPCIALSASCAIKQLMHLPFNNISYKNINIKFGDDILFWSLLSKFGFELIARQRFIPSVVASGKEKSGKKKTERLYARWHPVYNYDKDSKRIDLFINSMPYISGAAAKPGKVPEEVTEQIPDQFSPAKLTLNFLNTGIDETCRQWFGEKIKTIRMWENKTTKDTVPSLWLSALGDIDGELSGSTHQRSILKTGVDKWSHAIKTAGRETPFRTCFRLEQPHEEFMDVYGDKQEKQHWSISFHLQAMDDKSLLVPAEKIWKSKSLNYLNTEFENPQEMFLGDLAKATRLFPAIEHSLKTKRPEKCTIGTEGAYWFLKEGAWLLEESGYGILIPSWWSKKGAASDLKIKAKSKSQKQDTSTGKAFFGLDSIINFDWDVAIGDEILSREELEELSKLKVPLVKVRGRWIEFKKDRIEDALKFLDKFENQGMALADALRINSGVEDVGIPMEFESSGWLENIMLTEDNGSLNESIGSFKKIRTPKTFNGKLRPYQETGFSWLSFLKNRRLGACLADDMGLGKTIQVISMLLHDKDVSESKGKDKNGAVEMPVLLVAPTSVIGNWHHELAKFAPTLSVMVHHGADRLSGKKFTANAKEHDVVVTTYALSVRDQKDLSKIKWNGIILDEAQSIKNPYTKQAQSIRKISKNAGYRIALTGTPIENRLSELWSIMEFLNSGYLRSFKEFKENFSVPIERYKNPDVSGRLKNLVKPFILRRVKTDKNVIRDLPDKIEAKTFCTLTVEQTTLYKAVVDEMMQEIEKSDGMKRRGLVLSALTKLKQICNHPALFLHDGSSLNARSGKLEQLKDMLDNVLSANEKALIFTQYSEMGEMLKNHLEESYGREVFFLHGAVSQKKRDKMVTVFQGDEHAPPIFILSVKAGGLGLNLTSANHVFHFDRWWNPAVENQATDRSFRIGQRKNVQVYKFITEGTLEEKIDDMIESKKDLSDSILSAGESMLTELSNEKIREMFSLKQEY